MKIYQFTALDTKDKASAILEGNLIAMRMNKTDVILLYWLDNFFVEVSKDRADNQFKKFVAFKSSVKLDPYRELMRTAPLSMNRNSYQANLRIAT